MCPRGTEGKTPHAAQRTPADPQPRNAPAQLRAALPRARGSLCDAHTSSAWFPGGDTGAASSPGALCTHSPVGPSLAGPRHTRSLGRQSERLSHVRGPTDIPPQGVTSGCPASWPHWSGRASTLSHSGAGGGVGALIATFISRVTKGLKRSLVVLVSLSSDSCSLLPIFYRWVFLLLITSCSLYVVDLGPWPVTRAAYPRHPEMKFSPTWLCLAVNGALAS